MNRIARTCLAAAAIALVPASAMAVSASSGDGSGNQHVTTGYSHGFKAAGQLTSQVGQKVYFSGLVVYNSYPDEVCGSYTSDTTSESAVNRGGTCTDARITPPSADAAKARVCRNRSALPDPCGNWSSKDTF